MPVLSPTWIAGAVVASLACLATWSTMAAPVAACTGGTPFDWAVAHAHGGLIRARIVSTATRDDQTIDVSITNLVALRGDPPRPRRVHAVIGAVCEQSVDAGETAIILFDVRGGPYSYPYPLVYIVEGPDALATADVAAVLASLPATDTTLGPVPATPASATPGPAGSVLVAGVIGLLVAVRRFRRSLHTIATDARELGSLE